MTMSGIGLRATSASGSGCGCGWKNREFFVLSCFFFVVCSPLFFNLGLFHDVQNYLGGDLAPLDHLWQRAALGSLDALKLFQVVGLAALAGGLCRTWEDRLFGVWLVFYPAFWWYAVMLMSETLFIGFAFLGWSLWVRGCRWAWVAGLLAGCSRVVGFGLAGLFLGRRWVLAVAPLVLLYVRGFYVGGFFDVLWWEGRLYWVGAGIVLLVWWALLGVDVRGFWVLVVLAVQPLLYVLPGPDLANARRYWLPFFVFLWYFAFKWLYFSSKPLFWLVWGGSGVLNVWAVWGLLWRFMEWDYMTM